jgi:cobalt/nickel transport system permease protein
MKPFFEYFKKDHILSKIDARVKLICVLAVLAMVLSYRGFLFPIATTVLCLALCWIMRVPSRVFVLRFSEPVFIAAIILFLKLFFSGNQELFSIDIFGMHVAGYRDGLLDGLMIGSRIMAAVSIVALMGFSTPFTELMAGLSWFKVPKGFIEILMFAYRYIFVLFEDAAVIYSAQKNRLGYSNLRRGLSSFGVLAGSLTLKALDHSHNTTVAMVQRGYDGNIPLLKHKAFRLSEVAASVVFMAGMGLLWNL